MELLIKISGCLMLLLALIHVGFPRYFNWKQELAGLNLINRQMMHVHMFFIAFMVGLMGVYCILFADEILQTTAGRHISLGISIFWFARLFFQLFIYSPKLWKGRVFETTIHILFTLLWSYFGIVFLLVCR